MRKIINMLFVLLPFVLFCIPGYSLNDDIIIQAYDVYFPLLFFVLMIRGRCRIYKSAKAVYTWWNIFVWILICSLFLTCIIDGNFYFGAILKSIRLFYPSIMVLFFFSYSYLFAFDRFLQFFFASMLLCPLIAIVGYFFQIDSLIAKQSTMVGDALLFRAGSFWKDSGVLAIISSLFSLISIAIMISKKLKVKLMCLLLISLSLNLTALGLSFSRTGFLILGAGILYILFHMNARKIIPGVLPIVFLLVLLIFYLQQSDTLAELEQVYSRIDSIFSVNSGNSNDVSSGRTDLWTTTLFNFFNKSDFYRLLLGYGYKTDTNILMLSDNTYIYVLISTGFIGFLCFFFFMFVFTHESITFRAKSTLLILQRIVLYGWIISMFLVDSLTYIPVVVLCFLFFTLSRINRFVDIWRMI